MATQDILTQTKVGKSDRTPFKHSLLNSVLGREIGALSKGNDKFMNALRQKPYTVYDLTAGDGIDTDQSGTCSPRIIAKHLAYAQSLGIDAHGVLIEKTPTAFQSLRNQGFSSEIVSLIYGDSLDIENIPFQWQIGAGVFVYNDPNHVDDWALTAELLDALKRDDCFFTTISTLGCNVGGIKRLGYEQRLQWYIKLDQLLRAMPSHHDAVLVALKGDCSQWAYILTGPEKWRNRYSHDIALAAKKWPSGYDCAWFKRENQHFNKLVDILFQTKKELAA